MQRECQPTRRGFLRAVTASAATAGAAGWRIAPAAAQTTKAQHVALVIFGGGVGFNDIFPRLNPQTKKFDTARDYNGKNVFKLFNEGTGVRFLSPMVGHYAAISSILTGALDAPAFRGSERPKRPTIVEYVRKQRAIDAGQVWMCVGGDDTKLLSYSSHAQYGARFGANLLNARDLFGGQFAQTMDKFAKPDAPSDGEASVLARLHGALGEGGGKGANVFDNDPATQQRLQKLIAYLLATKKPPVVGTAASDVWALRAATEVIKIFRPTLLIVVLTAADIGHVSYRQYENVIESNDAELGELIKAIDADAILKDSTAIFICPDFGRDTSVNAAGGKDHGADEPSVTASWLVARGAGLVKGAQPANAMRTIDVCPTICAMLGAKAEAAEGRVVGELIGT